MIAPDTLERLEQQDLDILDHNDRGDYTVPSEELFPHQWLWDSCFVAIGLAHYDPERAVQELRSLMRGRWDNDMQPNEIVSDGWRYLPERINLRSRVNPNAPENLTTSGITQPPMIAEAVWQVGQQLEDEERHTFYKEMAEGIIDNHMYLFRERELNGDGLVSIFHPYESGMDNTPSLLMPVREHYDVDLERKPTLRQRLAHIAMDHLRRDTRHVAADERMHHHDVLTYQKIMKTARDQGYDMARIVEKTDIPIFEDLAYNSIFMHANTKLQMIAEDIGIELPDELQAGIERQRQGFENLWNPKIEAYCTRDARTGKLIPIETASNLLSLYAYADLDHMPHQDEVVQHLSDPNKFWTKNPLPSVPLDSPYFERNRYWAGPVWSWINWLVEQGLRDRNYHYLANVLREATILHDGYEYSDTFTGEPLGIGRFAGAAAVSLDGIQRYTKAYAR